MQLRWSFIIGVLAILAPAWPALGDEGPAAKPPDKPHVTAQEVDAAIAKGVDYLWSLQQPTGLFSSGMYHLIGQAPGTGNVPGMGLGLTLVQRVAEAYGGCVEVVASSAAAGTTFRLRLP